MDRQTTFIYQYSALERREVEEIRKKYLSCEESALEELRRLDGTVQSSGIAESLCVGIGGALICGLGASLILRVIGNGVPLMVLGVLLSIVGVAGILAAYPLYHRVFERTKQKLTPRILELSAGSAAIINNER